MARRKSSKTGDDLPKADAAIPAGRYRINVVSISVEIEYLDEASEELISRKPTDALPIMRVDFGKTIEALLSERGLPVEGVKT